MNSRGYQQISGDEVEYNTSSLKPQVQQVKRNRPYEFSDDGSSSEAMALTVRSQSSYKSTGQFGNEVELMEIKLHPNDSLRSLSIKFMCSVSELRKVNNIASDNQAYALKTLKVPVRSHQHQLIEELKKYAQEQPHTSESHKGAGVGSTDASEDEDESMNASLQDQEIHDSYEGGDNSMTSIPLLSKSSREQSHGNSNRDKKKFEKIMEKNKELIEGIKPSLDRHDSFKGLGSPAFNSTDHLAQRQKRCGYMQPSPVCVLVSFVLLVIVVPIVVFALYENGHLSWVTSP